MAYIADTDITDEVIKQFSSSFSIYHALTDNQLVDIGIQLGVDDTDDFDTDEDGYINSWYIRQYLVNWFCMRLCLDKMGVNNVSVSDMEKYAVKYNFYKKEVESKEKKITRQMLTGTVTNIADRSQFNNFLYRS